MKKALLIGINYQNTGNDLYGCENDIENIRTKLGEYDFSNVKILTEKGDRPTRSKIIESIRWLVENNTKGDVLFFHYSGHGGQRKDNNRDEVDKKDELIYPLGGEISDDELNQLLVQPLSCGCKLFCLFDSCHSGSVLDLKYTFSSDTFVSDQHYKDSFADVILISGCRDEQTSADSFEESMAQGAMTFSFLQVLKQLGDPSIKDLYNGMLNLLTLKGYDQRPQLSIGRLLDADMRLSSFLN